MLKRTPLYEQHCHAGAKLVDFAGWEMPIHYGSQIEEHHQVRQSAGMFDVSHMGVVDIEGEQARDFLRYALANDIAKLKNIGDALYTCLLNESGGVIDDLIVYYLSDNTFRLVINASRRQHDLTWLRKLSATFNIAIKERADLCILAVQGPQAMTKVNQLFPSEIGAQIQKLKPFKSILIDQTLIARTGYTGEDGVEMILPAQQAITFWSKLLELGVKPCGLGARDTLRLEAGLNLYGADMDEQTSPLSANLAWTISWQDEKRDFVGKHALQKQKAQGIQDKLVGLVMEQPGVLRNQQRVMIEDDGEGVITSGSFSPTLKQAIALARVPVIAGHKARVERRGRFVPVKIIKPPFVRHGKKVFE